jgi:hypothetical protein
VRPEPQLLLELREQLSDPTEFRRQVILLTGMDKLLSGTFGGLGLLVAALMALAGVQPGATVVAAVAAALLINMFVHAIRTRTRAADSFATQGYLATLEGFEAVSDHTLWMFLPVGYPSRLWAIGVAQAMADQLDLREISNRAEHRLVGFSTGTDAIQGLIDGPSLIGFATHGGITAVHGYTGRPSQRQSLWAVVPLTQTKAAKYRIRPKLLNHLMETNQGAQGDE